jgi:hypothetical protein
MYTEEDLETQKKGMVVVFWALGPRDKVEPLSFQHLMKQIKTMGSLPLRIAALHFCYDRWYTTPLLATLKVGFDMFTRLRIRSHYGERLCSERIICFYATKCRFLTSRYYHLL